MELRGEERRLPEIVAVEKGEQIAAGGGGVRASMVPLCCSRYDPSR
jgi:hypothetical protein